MNIPATEIAEVPGTSTTPAPVAPSPDSTPGTLVPTTESDGNAPAPTHGGEAANSDASEAPTGADAAKEDASTQSKKSALQKRIDELVRDRHEAQRELEAERVERFRRESQAQVVQSIQQIEQQEPQPDTYETLLDYQRAHSQWATQRAVAIFDARAKLQQTDAHIAAVRQQAEQAEVVAKFQTEQAALMSKLKEGPTKYKDFADALNNPELPSARGTPLFDAVMAADNAVDISYALAKNPGEYVRLLHLSTINPVLATKEILALDAKFSGASKTTAAPPPPPEIGNRASGAKAPEEMTDAEWIKAREAELRKRRHR